MVLAGGGSGRPDPVGRAGSMSASEAVKSSDLPELLDRLALRYEPLPRALPHKALDWVLWANAAHLVPDERRTAAHRALAKATGLSADGILGRPREELRAIAALGGMHAGGRVAKWIAIAETVRDSFGGDLEAVIGQPLAEARRALKTFPGIGAPGADRVLLFTRTHALVAVESNGLRVLIRPASRRRARATTGRIGTRRAASSRSPSGAARG